MRDRWQRAAIDTFERGSKDVFVIRHADVGAVRLLRISHDGSSSRPSWKLAGVTVRSARPVHALRVH